ncbi:hypothetical protein LGT41_0010695 [Abyssibius alkaniclasticus]|uniref:hypothetical protein n=1 Tax=Abyssibius alkaniclasticus TaxID=2881234 RepID=UPI0023642F82|nr:hypothetical protein [Abyssibius alkaniclasticus]UPH70266.1 hypothetical protein LGT41_0010695 [Abyssibius alkaniclasticus]
MVLTLENAAIQLTVAPDIGARVTKLIDLRNGRDWLVGGRSAHQPDENADYTAQSARGWDECFPTVAPCQSPDWGRRLRDHGDIWGRRVECEQNEAGIQSTFFGSGYRFTRRLSLHDETVVADYWLENTGSSARPYLWSQHCLLNCNEDDRLSLVGIGEMEVSYNSETAEVSARNFNWPKFDSNHPDLTHIEPQTACWAAKTYAPIASVVDASVMGADGGAITFSWLRKDIPFLGLWLDYGGWPANEPVHQVAIEPTNAPADDLAAAVSRGLAPRILPGETHFWSVSITLSQTNNSKVPS